MSDGFPDHPLGGHMHMNVNPHGIATFFEGINDMTLLRHVRPEDNSAIPYADDRFVKDYSNPGWETARLVHFAHGLTSLPRSRAIEAEMRARRGRRR